MASRPKSSRDGARGDKRDFGQSGPVAANQWTSPLDVLTLTTDGVDIAALIGTSSTAVLSSNSGDNDLACKYAPERPGMLHFGSGLLGLAAIFPKKLGLGSACGLALPSCAVSPLGVCAENTITL